MRVLKLRRKRPETVTEITRRVRSHWCPTTAKLSDPTFRREVEREIAKARRRGLLIESPQAPESN